MAKTTYKVGDKVRILDTEKIMLGEQIKITDGFAKVASVHEKGYPRLTCRDGRPLIIGDHELKYIEKVEESDAKMTQFKVGDKVKVVASTGERSGSFDTKESAGWHVAGQGLVRFGAVGTITEISKFITVDFDNEKGLLGSAKYNGKLKLRSDEIELVSPKPTKKQRLTMLEQKVEAMQAEIESLKATQTVSAPEILVKSEVDIAKITEGFAKMFAKEKKPTPNEQRKAIIDEAKAFVKTIEHRAGAQIYKAHGDSMKRMLTFKYEVNAAKRTVVALGFGSRSNTLRGKGIAKCNPSDVFNADIGKAIALGRALGLDVSKFERAVQPSEVVVEAKVHYNRIGGSTHGFKHTVQGRDIRTVNNDIKGSVWSVAILDDSEAKY